MPWWPASSCRPCSVLSFRLAGSRSWSCCTPAGVTMRRCSTPSRSTSLSFIAGRANVALSSLRRSVASGRRPRPRNQDTRRSTSFCWRARMSTDEIDGSAPTASSSTASSRLLASSALKPRAAGRIVVCVSSKQLSTWGKWCRHGPTAITRQHSCCVWPPDTLFQS